MPLYKGYITKNRSGEIAFVNIIEIIKKNDQKIISFGTINLGTEFKERGKKCDMCGKSISGYCWISYEAAGYNFYKTNNIKKNKNRPIKILDAAFCTKKCYKLKKLTE